MNGRILIADDDEGQLWVFQKILDLDEHGDSLSSSDKRISFQVSMFRDGLPLSRCFRSEFDRGRRIPLCILDMMMTTMDGFETAEAVRSVDPDVFIIIVTSHNVSHDELMKSLKKDVYFMKKPVRPTELLALVSSLLISWNNQQTLKNTYQEMDAMRRQLQAVLNHSPTIIAHQDMTRRYQLINQRFTEVFGLTPEQVLGKTDADIFPKSIALTWASHIWAMIESGSQIELEEQIQIRGTKRTYFTNRYPVIGQNGQISGMGTMYADITKRREAEDAVREKEAYLKAIMATIQSSVMIIDPKSYKIIDANPWASQLLGYAREDLVGRDFYELLCPDWISRDPSQRVVSNEYVLQTTDKERIYARRSVAKARVKDREYLVQSLLDITDIKHLMKKQDISIDLAKVLLNMINRIPPRHTPLSEALVLFADVISVPCLKEGGDHCFVRTLRANTNRHEKTVVSLKDQSGHEVGCVLRSIITDMIHHGILNHHEDIPLEETLSRLNDEICRSEIFGPGEFFTSVNAEIDHQTLEMRYVLTGHPRFVLIRGNKIRGLPEYGKPGRNLPIPVHPDTVCSGASCLLEDGDRLIFFTDGLTDMSRAKQKRISFETLRHLVGRLVRNDPVMPVADLMREILKIISEMSGVEVIPFSKNTSQDDVTILCLEIENQKARHERILRPKHLDDLCDAIADLHGHILHELRRRGFGISDLGIRSILTESIVNAWKHGNHKAPHKSVTVRWRYGNDFHLEVIDKGSGFDFHCVPDPKSEENMIKASGRGIYIIRRFSDTVRWEQGGSHLILTVRKHSDPKAQAHTRRSEKLMKLW